MFRFMNFESTQAFVVLELYISSMYIYIAGTCNAIDPSRVFHRIKL